jgi:hypothetical protein
LPYASFFFVETFLSVFFGWTLEVKFYRFLSGIFLEETAAT